MRVIAETRSISWAESIRVALLAHDVDVVVMDEAAPGTLGMQGSIRIAVGDADVARAEGVLAEMRPESTAPRRSWRWHKRALITFGTAMAATVAALYVDVGSSPSLLRVGLLATGFVFLLATGVLMWVGDRADRG